MKQSKYSFYFHPLRSLKPKYVKMENPKGDILHVEAYRVNPLIERGWKVISI